MLLSTPSLHETADIVAIQHLAVSYAEAVCRGEIAEAVQAYAPDGVLRSPTTADAVGRDAIAETITTATAGMDFVFQTVHLGLVKVEGDRAHARFPITEWGRTAERSIVFLGMYEDELVRLPEGWRFASRYLAPRSMGRNGVFGGKVVSLAVLQPFA